MWTNKPYLLVLASSILLGETMGFRTFSLRSNIIASRISSVDAKQTNLMSSFYDQRRGIWKQQQQPRSSLLRQTALEVDVPILKTGMMTKVRKFATIFCNLFPVWTVITAAVALTRPSTFLSIPPSTFPAQIGMLMLCMGITLKPSDFQRVSQRPAAVVLAFVGCYGVVSIINTNTFVAATTVTHPETTSSLIAF